MAGQEFQAGVEVELVVDEVALQRKLQRSISRIEQSLTPINFNLTRAFQQLDAATAASTNRLKNQLQAAFKGVGQEGTAAFQKANASANTLNNNIAKIPNTVAGITTSLNQLSAPLERAAGLTGQLSNGFNAARGSLQNLLGSVGQLSGGLNSIAALNLNNLSGGINSIRTGILGSVTAVGGLFAGFSGLSTLLQGLQLKKLGDIGKEPIKVQVIPEVQPKAVQDLNKRLAELNPKITPEITLPKVDIPKVTLPEGVLDSLLDKLNQVNEAQIRAGVANTQFAEQFNLSTDVLDHFADALGLDAVELQSLIKEADRTGVSIANLVRQFQNTGEFEISDQLAELVDGVEGVGTALGKSITDGTSQGAAKLTDFFKIGTKFSDRMKKTFEDLKQNVNFHLSKIGITGTTGPFESIGKVLEAGAKGIGKKIGSIFDGFAKSGGAKLQSLGAGFTNLGTRMLSGGKIAQSLAPIMGRLGASLSSAGAASGAMAASVGVLAGALAVIVGTLAVVTAALAAFTIGTIAAAKAIVSQAAAASDLNESINATAVLLGNASGEYSLLTDQVTGTGSAYQLLTDNIVKNTSVAGAGNVEANKAADTYFKLTQRVSDFGLTQAQANEALNATIPLLKNAGLEGTNLANAAGGLLERAADIGSVFNEDVNVVLERFGAGIRGETEVVRRYGITIDEATVKTFAYANGIATAGSELTEGQKQLARYGVILEQTSGSAGDFGKTFPGSLANQQKALKSTISEFKTQISAVFLPAALRITGAIRNIVDELGPKFVQFFQKAKPFIDATATAFEFVAGAAIKLGRTVLNFLTSEGFATFIKNIGNFAVKTFEIVANVANTTLNIVKKVIDALDVATGPFTEFVDIPKDLIKDTLADFGKFVKSIQEEGAKAFEGLEGLGFGDVDLSATVNVKAVLDDSALKTAFDDIKSKLQDQFNTNKGLIDAQKALNDAVAAQKQLEIDLADKNREILALKNNQFLRQDELADSADRLRGILRSIQDLDEQRGDALADELVRLRELEDFRADFGDRAESAELARQRAILARNRAEEDYQKLIKEGDAALVPSVNLAGLSLDQARAKLAAARSTLRAQRQGAKTDDDAVARQRAIEDAELNRKETVIGVRDAERSIRDLKQEQKDTEAAALIARREYNELVGDLLVQEASLQRDRIEAEQENQKLRNGEIGILKTIRDLEKERDGLQKQLKDSIIAVTDAQDQLALKIAESKDDVNLIADAYKRILDHGFNNLTNTKQINDEYKRGLGLLNEQVAAAVKLRDTQAANIADLNNKIRALFAFRETKFKQELANKVAQGLEGPLTAQEQAQITNFQNNPELFGRVVAEAIAQGINLADPKALDKILDIIKKIVRELNIPLPAGFFAKGTPKLPHGYIPGVPSKLGKSYMVNVGEHNRGEAVIPLEDDNAMFSLFKDSRIFKPVFAVIQKMLGTKAKGFSEGGLIAGGAATVVNNSFAPYVASQQAALSPILAQLPKVNFPTPQTMVGHTVAIQQSMPVVQPISFQQSNPAVELPKFDRGYSSQSAAVSRQEEKRRMEQQADLTAKALAKELIAAGVGGEDGSSAPITIQIVGSGNAALDARKLEREIETRRKRKGRL